MLEQLERPTAIHAVKIAHERRKRRNTGKCRVDPIGLFPDLLNVCTYLSRFDADLLFTVREALWINSVLSLSNTSGFS